MHKPPSPTISEEDFIHNISAALTAPATPHPAYKLSAKDRATYLAMLNGEQPTPLDPAQADTIITALWSIMTAFVDLGFPPAPYLAGLPTARAATPVDKMPGASPVHATKRGRSC